MKRILAALLLTLACLAPVRAQTPPLIVFASTLRSGSGDVVPGEPITVVITIYSTSTVPLTPTIDLYASPGLAPTDAPRPGSVVVWIDEPMIVLARYKVLGSAAGWLTVTAVVCDGVGNVAQASTQVRRGGMQVWLPMVLAGIA